MISFRLIVLVSVLGICNKVVSLPCSVGVDIGCKADINGNILDCNNIPVIAKPEDCTRDINFIYNVKNTGNVVQTIKSIARTRFAETSLVDPIDDTLDPGLNTLAVEALTAFDLCASQKKEFTTVVTVQANNSTDICENASLEKLTLNFKCNIQVTVNSCMYDSTEDCSFPGSCDSIQVPTSVNGCNKVIKYSYTLENIGPVPEQIFKLNSTFGGDILEKSVLQNQRILDPGVKIDVEDIVTINVCDYIGTEISNEVTVYADTSPINLGDDCKGSQTYSFSIPSPSPSFVPSLFPSRVPSVSMNPTKTHKTAKSNKGQSIATTPMPSCMPFSAPSSIPTISLSPTKTSKSSKSKASKKTATTTLTAKSSKQIDDGIPSPKPTVQSTNSSNTSSIDRISTYGQDSTNEETCKEIMKGQEISLLKSTDIVTEERNLQMEIYVESDANLLSVEKELSTVATNAVMTTMYGCSNTTSSNLVRNLENVKIYAVTIKEIIREKDPLSGACTDPIIDNLMCVSYTLVIEISFDKNDKGKMEDISVTTLALLKGQERNIVQSMNSQVKGVKIYQQPNEEESKTDGSTIGLAVGGAVFFVLILFSSLYAVKRNIRIKTLHSADALEVIKTDEFLDESLEETDNDIQNEEKLLKTDVLKEFEEMNSGSWFIPKMNVFTSESLSSRWVANSGEKTHNHETISNESSGDHCDENNNFQTMPNTAKRFDDIDSRSWFVPEGTNFFSPR